MLTIGEFSQITRLTIKTLRYYHELGILVPIQVDEMTGYRYYDENSCNQATAVIALKDMGFSLQEIKKILAECETEDDLHRFVRRKLDEVRSKVATLKQLENRLSSFERRIHTVQPDDGDGIRETTLNIPHLAAVPVRGRYDEIGTGFRLLYRKAGRYIVGKPYCFCYHMEYREDDASMEAIMELSREIRMEGIEYRRIENLAAVRMVYRGPYGGQGGTYMKLFNYCHERGYSPVPPVIEHYIKGPGMILRGNPENYITECIVPVDRWPEPVT